MLNLKKFIQSAWESERCKKYLNNESQYNQSPKDLKELKEQIW